MIDNPSQSQLFESEYKATSGEPVECLGLVFANDDDRRSYFTELLRQKLGDPEFRQIEGFPIGEDEDILSLSDPPYYTACPNPFIHEFVRLFASSDSLDDEYLKTPFSGDMHVSTRHPVYSFHPYHTKVPPDIIKNLIEHYTDIGDLIFDGFAGTGMTGVAARESGRNAVIGDLCPIASFISAINNSSHNLQKTLSELDRVISASESLWGHLYTTNEGGKEISVNYFVWSDVFVCPECVFEFPFFPTGVIHFGNKVKTRKTFPCPSCGAELNVRRVERVLIYEGKKKHLVWVNAGKGRNRINRAPTKYDLSLAKDIETLDIPVWFPKDSIKPDGYSAKLAQLGNKAVTDISRFLSKRNLIVFSDLWARISDLEDSSIKNLCFATLTSIFTVISERQGYFGGGGGMSGNLYMPIVRMEKNVYDSLRRKLRKLQAAEEAKQNLKGNSIVTTQSLTTLSTIPDSTIDYIYTDPPFGANIIYSEMNLILEGWLRIKTNSDSEAVMDETRNRLFNDYAILMSTCFIQCYRILKPGRWMTVEFHNTKASVWNLIQTAIGDSGFVVAQVDVLDKGSTTILADIRPGAAKLDLIISSYKPIERIEQYFMVGMGTEEGVYSFIRTHLKQLPIFIGIGTHAEIVAERQNYLLFDRMVAFHVQRGVTVPLSISDFYIGLSQRYPERDGMYFLPEQVAEYDRKRLSVNEISQMILIITDESTSIQWLRQQLMRKPQSFQDLHPQFLREIGGWQVNEQILELSDLLKENFLIYNGSGEIPSQIHSYLSSNYKDLRNLPKDDPALQAKARDRWYVPDPNKAADLEKLRERHLLREFEIYQESKARKLKIFRLEAVRAGFKRAWQEGDYQTIIAVAKKIPDKVLQEDPKLLMWYDQAVTRTGGSTW